MLVSPMNGLAADSKPFALPDPVAVVEGKPITKAEVQRAFDSVVASSAEGAGKFTEEEKEAAYRAIVDNMITERLLLRRSEKATVTDAEVDAQLDKFRQQAGSQAKLEEAIAKSGQSIEVVKASIRDTLKEQKWIDEQIAGRVNVNESDARFFYQKNPEKFKAPEMVRASHILIGLPKDANAEQKAAKAKQMDGVITRIKQGEPFETVAADVSEDPSSKASGGDLNFFPRGSMVPEFEDAAFKLTKGEVSAPVTTALGLHLIKVTDRRDAHTIPFEEVKSRIADYLKQEQRNIAIARLLQQMRSEAKVKLNLPEPSPSKQ